MLSMNKANGCRDGEQAAGGDMEVGRKRGVA